MGIDLLDLEDGKFDRLRSAEYLNSDFEDSSMFVDLGDFSGKVLERPDLDAHQIAW